jgi:hypothetical protein
MAGDPPTMSVGQLFTCLEELQQHSTEYGLEPQIWTAAVLTAKLYRAWARGEKPERQQWEEALKALPQNRHPEEVNQREMSRGTLACAFVYWAATAGVTGERGYAEATVKASRAYEQLRKSGIKPSAEPRKRPWNWLLGRNS